MAIGKRKDERDEDGNAASEDTSTLEDEVLLQLLGTPAPSAPASSSNSSNSSNSSPHPSVSGPHPSPTKRSGFSDFSDAALNTSTGSGSGSSSPTGSTPIVTAAGSSSVGYRRRFDSPATVTFFDDFEGGRPRVRFIPLLPSKSYF